MNVERSISAQTITITSISPVSLLTAVIDIMTLKPDSIITLWSTQQVRVMSKLNLGGNNDCFLERTSGGGNLRISGNYAASSPCNLTTTGGTITTAQVIGSSSLTLGSISNGNINMTPNGSGIVTTSSNLQVPATGQILFGSSGTSGKFVNNTTNAWQLQDSSVCQLGP